MGEAPRPRWLTVPSFIFKFQDLAGATVGFRNAERLVQGGMLVTPEKALQVRAISKFVIYCFG